MSTLKEKIATISEKVSKLESSSLVLSEALHYGAKVNCDLVPGRRRSGNISASGCNTAGLFSRKPCMGWHLY